MVIPHKNDISTYGDPLIPNIYYDPHNCIGFGGRSIVFLIKKYYDPQYVDNSMIYACLGG